MGTYRTAEDRPDEAREADDALRDAVCEADEVRWGHCGICRQYVAKMGAGRLATYCS